MRRLWATLFLLALPALALEAGFKDQDVNGDGVPEKIAVTNLMDLAFDQKGQVVGWYVKTYKGTAFNDYTRAPNLSGNGPVVAPVGFTPEKAEYQVEDGRLLARFQGQEGTLTYRIEKGRYTVQISADFPLTLRLSAHGNKDLIRQSLFMNLIFIFLVLQFPAGVTLYWVLSNLIGLVQQWLINKSLKPLAA
ncbi:hypothetical protein CSW29_04490 [Thermus scotoductus]|uniref:Membrane insertase YidC/Oxa/ALB C-terminal domain-containing protein n=1 Tax=Thermus scotoductus TaxID=37636 RepID=A0A430UHV6_THESC|nr:YidC/Oxa1 family membrane protein insertase [Thermus scotoductus]RTI01252.1 hypothetical protein CSW29_04490 [Thermus scotoductus]